MLGTEARRRPSANAGDTVAFGRLEKVKTGETVSVEKAGVAQAIRAPGPEPVCGTAIVLKDRKDEVKLSSALAKLGEEDPSLSIQHDPESHQVLLLGHGEMHLRVTLERLARKYGLVGRAPAAAHRLPRDHPRQDRRSAAGTRSSPAATASSATWWSRSNRCHAAAGSSSTNASSAAWYRSSSSRRSRSACMDYFKSGPLGCPVVDVTVTLTDGSTHSVDSSDMAFRQAARIAMSEGMPQCQPVLLEPIMAVEIAVPNEATARVNGMISQRRGQITGYDARPDWPGWDLIDARLPGVRDGRSDRRAAVGDGRCRHVLLEAQPLYRVDRQAGGKGDRPTGQGG